MTTRENRGNQLTPELIFSELNKLRLKGARGGLLHIHAPHLVGAIYAHLDEPEGSDGERESHAKRFLIETIKHEFSAQARDAVMILLRLAPGFQRARMKDLQAAAGRMLGLRSHGQVKDRYQEEYFRDLAELLYSRLCRSAVHSAQPTHTTTVDLRPLRSLDN